MTTVAAVPDFASFTDGEWRRGARPASDANPAHPFAGTEESSSGSREQGEAVREFFTERKTVYVNIR